MIYAPRLERCAARPTSRKVPRFLVLRCKYNGMRERFGVSNEEHVVSGPLRSAKIADTVEHYYDVDRHGGIFGDSKLVDLVSRVRPDLIIVSSYSPFSSKHTQFEVLKAIRAKCHIPLLVFWWDVYQRAYIHFCSHMLDAVDLHIEGDGAELSQHFSDKNNFLRLWAPLDFSVFHPGAERRDIPISFVGSLKGYQNIRVDYLNYLREKNVDVYQTGGVSEQRVSLEEYADILRRSKISLHFSQTQLEGHHQLKGRVFETMFSGALLMESENSEIKQYFTPDVDYVSFDSKADMLDKVRYYLEHEGERQEIANNGYRKATTEYNHQVFWNRIMDKLAELKVFPAPLRP
jgi:glycosyltransferase involved in cell wall biosynthesis